MLKHLVSIATIAVMFFAANALFAQASEIDNSVATGQNQWTAEVEVPITVTSSDIGGVPLGTIAPGLTKTFPSPTANAINFTVAGADDALFSFTGVVNLKSATENVSIAGITWEINNGSWADLGGATTDDGITHTETKMNNTFKPNGERQFRVYPTSITADNDAMATENPVFNVTLTAEYTGY